jgi:uncharacterized protein (DUF305 family)
MPKTEYIEWLGRLRHQLREMYGIDIADMLSHHPEEAVEMATIFDAAYKRGADARKFADTYGLILTQSSNVN